MVTELAEGLEYTVCAVVGISVFLLLCILAVIVLMKIRGKMTP